MYSKQTTSTWYSPCPISLETHCCVCTVRTDESTDESTHMPIRYCECASTPSKYGFTCAEGPRGRPYGLTDIGVLQNRTKARGMLHVLSLEPEYQSRTAPKFTTRHWKDLSFIDFAIAMTDAWNAVNAEHSITLDEGIRHLMAWLSYLADEKLPVGTNWDREWDLVKK